MDLSDDPELNEGNAWDLGLLKAELTTWSHVVPSRIRPAGSQLPVMFRERGLYFRFFFSSVALASCFGFALPRLAGFRCLSRRFSTLLPPLCPARCHSLAPSFALRSGNA